MFEAGYDYVSLINYLTVGTSLHVAVKVRDEDTAYVILFRVIR